MAIRVHATAPRRAQLYWLTRTATYATLVAGAFLAGFPFFWMILTSLKTSAEANAIPPTIFPASPQWHNYLAAWQAAPFPRYFLNTAFIAAVIVLGVIATTMPAAYAFARLEFRGKKLLFTLFLATMMIPFEATLIPNYIIITKLRWYNTYFALIVPWTASVFSIFLLRQFFASVPEDLYDAAALDGCGHARTLWHVAFPLARAPLAAIVIFAFLGSWNSLLWPLLITSKEALRPIQLGLSVFVTEAGTEPHLLMAASAFTILPIVVLYFFAQRQFIEGIASSGLKG